MASAGTEHYSIGLRQANSFKQSGPLGTVPAPPPDKPSEGKVWAQAHQQVKPIWKLERKHVGTLSAGLGPGLLGVSPQSAYFFCPSTLCSSGTTAVIAGHSNSCYLHPLPDLFSSTLLYRRSNYRHKTYQQLESFCLRSGLPEKRPFSLPQKSLPVRLTANKTTSSTVSPMAQPMASSSTDPHLSLGAAGENPSGRSLASAVSGKFPSPLPSSTSSYKPMLNNNSFMRPNSTKVPLSQATEGLKPVSSPKIQLVSWRHSGGTGDCVLHPAEHKVPKSNGTELFDLQLDQVEAEDLEEELVDGLEDCCSHDENEEEERDSECSSFSAVSPSESIAVISRSCMEILTKPLASEKVVRPALIYSLFPNVPPTIYFGTRDERVEKLPWEQRKLLRWKMSAVTPNIVKQTIGRSHFKISKKNDDWLGCWGHHMKSPSFRSIREHQKLNHFPGSFQIGRKDRLWRNLSRMQSRFGKKEFSFFPQSFILPQDAKLLRKAWESSSRQKWIVKPPASARGIGIQVIHKWSQLPKRRPLLVQRYLHKPYLISGSKFDLRIYVYVTSYDPLRIYLFSDGLVRFASCKYSPSMKSLGNKFMHLTNYSVNKKNAEYQANADETACQGHKWALKALWNYLSQKGVNSDAIWEKIKDVVVKTIISSEPYVTSLLKMYVRRSYSCHELFGFDIMLDENLKPWVLEVNISPSLHSNSPLDISIKGQMIRDLLNLAGFVLPNTEDIISSSSSSSSSTTSLPSSPRDKSQMTPEHFTAQKMKKAYYLAQKTPDQEFYASVLDVLTPDDVRVLVEMEDEFSRRGQFERIFPSRIASRYLRFFDQPRYFNILTTQWEQKYHGNKLKGVDLLRSWCYKGFHTGAISDSAPVWSLPTSLLTVPKGDTALNAFFKSETSKLGKPVSSKDSEDTGKEPILSSQLLPVIKNSGQPSRLSASPTFQSTGDCLLAAVSP
uniref:Tubulin tyrosine ligase like 4 n=1 Tax=Rousettus aegyptiacus TaxID=9407 RepID=A0A7J8JNG6_ROUAE|nr:tubulin tyrosine ligase like 4 [Rousettus aegyptiacus]